MIGQLTTDYVSQYSKLHLPYAHVHVRACMGVGGACVCMHGGWGVVYVCSISLGFLENQVLVFFPPLLMLNTMNKHSNGIKHSDQEKLQRKGFVSD